MATTIDGAYENMKRYLSEKVKLPTAFFADNDMIALGAMKAMAEFGIRIPEDISIVGFDDLTFSSISASDHTPGAEAGDGKSRCKAVAEYSER